MKIFLIRHGATYGNSIGRYVGKTDEDLSDSGREYLQSLNKIDVARVFVSPLKRCLHTAEILVKSNQVNVVDDLCECNFGDFENLNCAELSGDMGYQRWIDSGGKLPFPNGENIDDFKKRSIDTFKICVEKACLDAENMSKSSNDIERFAIAFIVHNGTIMSIMQQYFGGDYYDYSVKNGKGYVLNYNSGEFSWVKFLI